MKKKYLKDKNGNIISLKIPESQVYDKDGMNLESKIEIIDSLLNQKDDYLILPNGTKMCWGIEELSLKSDEIKADISFPFEFDEEPNLMVSVIDKNNETNSIRWGAVYAKEISNISALVSVMDHSHLSNPSNKIYINWVAIGK